MEQCRGYLHMLPCAHERLCSDTKRRAADNRPVLERRQTGSAQCHDHKILPKVNHDNL